MSATGSDGLPRVLLNRAQWARLIVVALLAAFSVARVAPDAIRLIVKPSIATFGFFIFCLGGEYPTTFSDVSLDNPWRQVTHWIGDTLRGAAAGLAIGTLHA